MLTLFRGGHSHRLSCANERPLTLGRCSKVAVPASTRYGRGSLLPGCLNERLPTPFASRKRTGGSPPIAFATVRPTSRYELRRFHLPLWLGLRRHPGRAVSVYKAVTRLCEILCWGLDCMQTSRVSVHALADVLRLLGWNALSRIRARQTCISRSSNPATTSISPIRFRLPMHRAS